MISVGSILGGAFRLVRDHPLAVLVWSLIQGVAFVALFFALHPLFQVYADFVSAILSKQIVAAPGKPPDLQALQPLIARMQAAAGIVLLAELGLFALLMILFTATQRAVLRPAERGFFYLRLGGDEFRLMGLAFVLAVCLGIGMFIAEFVLVILVLIVAFATGSGAVTGVLVLALVCALMCAILYAEVRLSLAFPLSFVRRNFIVGEAWRLSKGRFWTLFGAYFILWLLYALLAAILFGIAAAPLISELSQAPVTPEAIQLAFQHQLARAVALDPVFIGVILGSALLGGLMLALFGGAVATAARDLLAGDPALSDAGGNAT